MNTLKKTWVWLCRFRKRKGYGVHSPFAYDFIRTVINEKGMYYAYNDLKPLRKGERSLAPLNVDKLLFRLANFAQPLNAVKVGEDGNLSLKYIQAGCRKTEIFSFTDAQDAIGYFSSYKSVEGLPSLGMLYICDTPDFKEVFEAAFPLIGHSSVIIIDAPYADEERRLWWHSLEEDSRIVLSFDLYDVGILLFDSVYNKQQYKVNFV